MTAQKQPEFEFAISYAGEDRAVAERLAALLAARGFVVFYDRRARARLLGADFRREARWIFGAGAKFFVPLISEHYAEKDFPQFEWDVAVREKRRRHAPFILPLRLDDTALVSLPGYVIYLDLRETSLEEAVDVLAEKRRGEPGAVTESYRLVTTFGLIVAELGDKDELPGNAPREYPLLCDWLENYLLKRLLHAPIKNVQMTEASLRDGECLSARVSFEWDSGSGPLTFGNPRCWQTLEVASYDEIYPPQ